jgi:hypothetical protein
VTIVDAAPELAASKPSASDLAASELAASVEPIAHASPERLAPAASTVIDIDLSEPERFEPLRSRKRSNYSANYDALFFRPNAAAAAEAAEDESDDDCQIISVTYSNGHTVSKLPRV